MGDKANTRRALAVCAGMAVAGAALAGAVASAQGPGDYQPTTTTTGGTTTTTTVPAPPDTRVGFRARLRSQVIDGFVDVEAECDESCYVIGRGRIRVTQIPGPPSGGGDGKSPHRSKTSKSFQLGMDGEPIVDGGETTLELAVPDNSKRAIKRARKFGGRIRARVTVNANDVNGNLGKERLREEMQRR